MNLADSLQVYVGFANFMGDPCSGCTHPLPPETYIAKVEDEMCEPKPCLGCGRLVRWHDGDEKVFACFDYPECIKDGKDFRMLRLCPDCLEFLILPSAPGVQ